MTRNLRPGPELNDAFDAGARRYDLMVALNPGYHHHLHAAARDLLQRIDPTGPVLDLGCGSGASTRALLDAGARRIVGIDASEQMLSRARAKSWPAEVDFTHGQAQQLGPLLDRAGQPEVAGIFAAYLFRNLSPEARRQTLADARERLRPGGWLVVHEYSVAGNRAATLVWSAVCWLVVIPMSVMLLHNTSLYRYLWRSVCRFASTKQFSAELADAGFTDVATRTVPGWQNGILHTYVGRRGTTPSDPRGS